jgi:hypothetical protein
MNNKDAKYYNEQIKYFEENSDDITKLLKQQIFVVKSSLGAISNTFTDMECNEEKGKTGLTPIKYYLELFASENREKLNLLTTNVIVEGPIVKIRQPSNILQCNLDMLLQIIVNARKEILQPQIISPKFIMDALIQIMPSFLKDMTSPIPLNKNAINLIYKVCDIHIYIDEGILGYVITLPLINREYLRLAE